MKEQVTTQVNPVLTILNLEEGDPIFDFAQEIKEVIAHRAYELFAANGFTHGHDREDWLRAESEILLDGHVEVSDTESELTILAVVPGFSGQDLQVRVAPRCVCITGNRQATSEHNERKDICSEQGANQAFCVLGLASEFEPKGARVTDMDGAVEIRLIKVGLGKKVPILALDAKA
jgi:HSP20 family molecular chaperone IbpA